MLIYLFTLFYLLASSLTGFADNLPSNYTGWSIYHQSYSDQMVGFTLPEGKESIYSLNSSSDEGIFKWGTWAEDKYVGAWQYGSEEDGFYFLYKSYQPLTYEWKIIGDGDGKLALAMARNAYDITYDYATKKVYLISQSKLYSNDLTSTTFTEIGTISDSLNPSSIACDKTGNLYAICQEGGPAYFASSAILYSINKTTAAATLVGNLGKNMSYNAQTAVFDYHTDALYFHNYSNGLPSDLKTYSVNTSTGEATAVTSMNGISIVGLASVYYPQNVPPGKAEDITLAVDAGDNNKINLSFKIPTIDANGAASTSASKAIVYLKNSSGEYDIIETINSITSGNTITKQYTVSGEGIYTYAVEIFTSEDIASGKVFGEISNILSITIPYFDDFSTQKPNVLIKETAEGSVFYSPDKGVGDSPCVGLVIGRAVNQLEINSIPFKKGVTYRFSFYAKTTTAAQDRIRYSINGGSEVVIYIEAGDTYEKYESSIYIATEDQDAVIAIYKHNTTGSDIIYIDDFMIEEVAPATVPGKATNVTAEAAANGGMNAYVTFHTPDLDMADNPLSDLIGVKVGYTTSVYTMANYVEYDYPVTGMGEEITVTVPIATAGSYYFVVTGYNSHGISYTTANTALGTWIGEDSTPSDPTNIQLANENEGKIKLTWEAVTTGYNKGYIDASQITYSVSYYGEGIPSSAPIAVYDIEETEYTTPSLPIGVYRFTVKAHYKGTASYASYSALLKISTMEESQVIVASVTGTSYSSSDYPFGAYFTFGASETSGLSQMTYSAEEIGGPMYIDMLYLFIMQSSNREEAELAYQISMGYKDELTFESTSDFVSKDQLEVVFDGTIEFAKTTSTIAIPIKGFYYDGTKPLVIQLAKPLDNTTSIDTYIQATAGYNRGVRTRSNTEDLIEIENTEDYPNTAWYATIPTLVVNKDMQLSSISGIVTSEETGLPLEYVSVKIVSVAGDGEKPLSIEIFTNEDGEYEFDTLPFNAYTIVISADGYVDYNQTMDINSVEDITLNVELEGANKISIKGTVINLNNDLLNGVEVIISRSEEIERITTGTDGAFEFNVYGSTQYTLTFNKEGMTQLIESVSVQSSNIVLEAFVLHYQIESVPSVNVSLNTNGTATVTWTASDPIPVNGYRVYRGIAEQSFEEYTELTSNPINGTSFVDDSLTSVEYGVFKYAVCTDWYGEDISAPVYSEEVEKNMTVNVTVNVKTNGASPEGAVLTLSNNNNTYNAMADAMGNAVFADVRRLDVYSLNITLDYHQGVTMNNIQANSDLIMDSDILEEIIATPTFGQTGSIENIIEINWTISNTVNPIEFEVYLDDELKKTLNASEQDYVFKNVEAGDRVVGLKAVFVSGKSEMVTKTISVEGLVKPAYLNVKVTDNKAELSWSPGGFSDPKAYEVYLNDELKADNITADEYTFENLENGTYRATVVAVYENGKSEGSEVSFQIDVVSIDQVSHLTNAYPNPTINGRFILELPTASLVKIYNMDGQLLIEKDYSTDGKYEIDLSKGQPGVYFIQIHSSNNSKVIKMIYNK